MTTPPRLTPAEYLAFLDSLPMHPSSLYLASEAGKVEDVKEILRNNPNLDVNWRNPGEVNTALYVACERGCASIVSILLAHPNIDVNVEDGSGYTPFKRVCSEGYTSCVRLLLGDSRVKVNEPNDRGDTPLYLVAFLGSFDIIKWWVASGREMDLGKPGDRRTDAIGAAEFQGNTEMVTLLERFKENPGVQTSNEAGDLLVRLCCCRDIRPDRVRLGRVTACQRHNPYPPQRGSSILPEDFLLNSR